MSKENMPDNEPVDSGAEPAPQDEAHPAVHEDRSTENEQESADDTQDDSVRLSEIELPGEQHDGQSNQDELSLEQEHPDPASLGTASASVEELGLPLEEVASRNYLADEANDEAFDDRYSRRDRMRGTAVDRPEPAAMLTADRLLYSREGKSAPEGKMASMLYTLSLGKINLGDSKKARYRKELDARISAVIPGTTKFVPVLTRKGGVGKTTVTTLLGMALASIREDRIIAIDANPDRGTLAERVPKQTRSTIRDLVTQKDSIAGFTDFSRFVSRDATRLDVIASDADPLLAEAFNDSDYNVVANLAAKYYSIVLTDCGTGIVHSVMRATLDHADTLVIVSGGSVEEARLASETLTWLESNGYARLVRNAVVAINTATQGTNLVKIDEMESHFLSRVRAVVRIPYDELLAAGSIVGYDNLDANTIKASRELAGLIVDGLVIGAQSE